MSKSGYSRTTFSGNIEHYDGNGHKIGESRPNLIGNGFTNYDAKGHKIGSSEEKVFGVGYNHYDTHGHKIGSSEEDWNGSGDYKNYDADGNYTGSTSRSMNDWDFQSGDPRSLHNPNHYSSDDSDYTPVYHAPPAKSKDANTFTQDPKDPRHFHYHLDMNSGFTREDASAFFIGYGISVVIIMVLLMAACSELSLKFVFVSFVFSLFIAPVFVFAFFRPFAEEKKPEKRLQRIRRIHKEFCQNAFPGEEVPVSAVVTYNSISKWDERIFWCASKEQKMFCFGKDIDCYLIPVDAVTNFHLFCSPVTPKISVFIYYDDGTGEPGGRSDKHRQMLFLEFTNDLSGEPDPEYEHKQEKCREFLAFLREHVPEAEADYTVVHGEYEFGKDRSKWPDSDLCNKESWHWSSAIHYCNEVLKQLNSKMTQWKMMHDFLPEENGKLYRDVPSGIQRWEKYRKEAEETDRKLRP